MSRRSGGIVKKVRNGSTQWYVQIELPPDENGERRRKLHSDPATGRAFVRRKDADAFLTELMGLKQRGGYVAPSKVTVGEYLTNWLDAQRNVLRPTTVASYQLVLNHVLPALGTMPLQRLSPGDLGRLYAELLTSGRKAPKRGNVQRGGLSPRSVQLVHRVLRRAFAEAVETGVLQRSPMRGVKAPRVPRAEIECWNADELRTFLASAADDRLLPLYQLAAATGMRRGEILGLRWSDVDMDAGTVRVVQTLLSVDYSLMFAEPKTAASRRSIAVGAEGMAALRAWRKRQAEERLRAGELWVDSGLVFTREDGTPMHPDLVSSAFDRAVRDSGVRRISFHGLRHTHATLLLLAGVHAKVVQERLGHSSIVVTMDTYSHVLPSMQEQAATAFDQLMVGP